jgi:putative SOS response-associated peptidase YedK
MCFNFDKELMASLRHLFGVAIPESAEPRFNIAPTQQVWVVRQEVDHNCLDHMSWGLVPHWVKDIKTYKRLINARSETVAEKPSFLSAVKYRRCIIPASGFYEWSHSVEPKQPYYIHMADSSPMLLAGIWDQRGEPEKEDYLKSFAILTTAANELIAPLHDRMPVIIKPEDCALWLSHGMHDPEQLRGLYKPYPSNLLDSYKVPSLVNNTRYDAPACIARI